MLTICRYGRRALASLLALFFLTVRASALDFDRGLSLSFPKMVRSIGEESKVFSPPAAPAPSSAPVSGELQNFWETLVHDAADSFCRGAEIRLNEEGRLESGPGIGSEFSRYLRKDPKGKLFLVDEAGVNLSLALGQDVASIPSVGQLNINFTGLMSGKSVVVRPLESDSYCRELGTLVKLYNVKVVLPAGARRVSGMKTGEIWKLPLIMRMGFGIGTGAMVNPFLYASVSAGISKESRPSVTLNRLDADSLRLRLRLDRVTLQTVGAALSSIPLPMADIGLISGENILAGVVNRAWAKEVNNYLAARLSFAYSRFSGKKLLLEFILNPNDPAQLAALEKFLQGDFGVIKRFIELGLNLNDSAQDDDLPAGVAAIAGAAHQAGQAVHADPSFAGSSTYSGSASEVAVQIPVVHTHNSSRRSAYNRYQSLDHDGEILHVRQETRASSSASLDIPLAGKLYKYDSEESVYVVNRQSRDGAVTRPVFMYQDYEGFVRQSNTTGKSLLEKANEVLRYVGMHGYGDNGWNTVPSEAVFPVLPGDNNAVGDFPGSKTCRSALLGFKVLINERGLQKILFAPAREIMRAFLNIVADVAGPLLKKAARFFNIDGAGKLGYDKAAARKSGINWDPFAEQPDDPVDGMPGLVSSFARDAEKVIADIVSVKNTAGWKAQSEKLAKIAAGNSKSGLKYGQFLKLIVQLVDPLDVSAEVFVHTDKQQAGEKDVTRTYKFFNTGENSFDSTVAGVNQMRDRFAEPSALSD